jgi:hypothetical protein
MMLLWFAAVLSLYAQEIDLSLRWASAFSIGDKHEFYQNNQVMIEPSDTYQLIFSIKYISGQPYEVKNDCVWIKIPGESLGQILVETTSDCQKRNQPQVVWDHLKSIQFELNENSLKLLVSLENGRVKTQHIQFLNVPKKQKFKLFDSSVPNREYKGVFFLAPNPSEEFKASQNRELADDEACKLEDQTCLKCKNNFYKIGDKDNIQYFCGNPRCGEKNRPACPRGEKWQRKRDLFSCRLNPEHLYCGPNLTLECQGELGFCR